MKIFVTGTRGIPDIPGGVEKHCQEVYPRIVAAGHEVIVAVRKPYVKDRPQRWHGVSLRYIFAPRKKSLEAIVHTFCAVIEARFCGCDILHVHAIGPGLMIPFARLLGLKVVWTNHGPDYDRGKWGWVAKKILRLGEWCGGHFAHERIAISTIISDIIKRRCGAGAHLIYNGVTRPELSEGTDFLAGLSIEPKNYILAVARFVPEKGLHDLIEAFMGTEAEYRLVIAGDADHESEYSRNLKSLAEADKRIVLTGYVSGEKLHQLFSHAGLFVLPSSHEGLPLALLEAMSYGLPVLVSDIPANKEVALPVERFFRCGDVEELRQKIEKLMGQDLTEAELMMYEEQIDKKYNWDIIAEKTLAVYRKCLR